MIELLFKIGLAGLGVYILLWGVMVSTFVFIAVVSGIAALIVDIIGKIRSILHI